MKQRPGFGAPVNRPLKPRVEPPVVAAPGVDVAAEAGARAPVRVAIFVCHGMGQQVRFETIDTVARGLYEHARTRVTGVSQPVVRLVKLGSQILGRAELTLPGPDGGHEVHVYEGYWAPLTEGRITLRGTITFLVKSGWQGFWSPSTFYRYLFGHFVSWPIDRLRTGAQFLAALLVVGALIAINAIQAAAILAWIAQARSWLPRAVVPRLSMDILRYLFLPLLVLGLLYFVRSRVRNKTAGRRLDTVIAAACYIAAAFIVATAVIMGWHVLQARKAAEALVSPSAWALVWNSVLWVGVAGASLVARWWVLQYGGDVAIYLSGYRLSVYDELRDRIQSVCCSAASAIYEHGGYDQHVFLGHSLGSVVAYDTLNQLLTNDAVGNPPRAVRPRTRGLITFGSPLDKTAYLFRVQVKRDAEVREGLATAAQPLIAEYANRPEWINLWSPADIISARLDYYDDPRAAGYRRGHIRNIRDRDATIPIAAHTQYWTGRALYRHLYRMATTT